MTLTVPHNKTKEEALSIIDRGAHELFLAVVGDSVELTDQRKEWTGSTMNFSFTGRLGFISVPLSGNFDIDDSNVTVVCNLPPMVKNFIGEDKVAASVQKHLLRLL